MQEQSQLTKADMDAFGQEVKVGLLSTINPEGLPHITLITSIMAKDAEHVMFGQFSEGQSKQNARINPNTAFLVMTTDRKIWRGRARWTHEAKKGADYERYNSLPMFRYNAYFGIHTVHYMDLVSVRGPEGLPLAGIAGSVLGTLAVGKTAANERPADVLNPFTHGFFNRLDTLKFLSFVGQDGFPWIIPCFGLRAAGTDRLVLSPMAYRKEFAGIARGQKVAVFGLSFKMEDVLVRGSYWGPDRRLGVPTAVVDVDFVYNSMPPIAGQIYPAMDLKPVRDF